MKCISPFVSILKEGDRVIVVKKTIPEDLMGKTGTVKKTVSNGRMVPVVFDPCFGFDAFKGVPCWMMPDRLALIT